MSDICKVNVSLLKSYEKEFNSELSNFNNKTYTTFSSGYINNCSDSYVRSMANKLESLYSKIKKGYNNIDKWWTDYNSNVEGLENYLSDNGSLGAITESSVRGSANSLPELKKYNIKYSGVVPQSVVSSNYNVNFVNNTVAIDDPFSTVYADYDVSAVDTGNVVKNSNIDGQIAMAEAVGADFSTNAQSIEADTYNLFDKLNSWWVEEAKPWIKNAFSDIWSALKSVGAAFVSVECTLTVFWLGVLEGIGNVLEAVVDTLAIVGTAIVSIVTGLFDAGNAIYCAITGKEYQSVTKQMWNGVSGFVAKKWVSGAFDKFYGETDVGKFIAGHAYGYETVREIGVGVGYTVGVIALTVLTAGIGSGSFGFLNGGIEVTKAVMSTYSMGVAAGLGLGKGSQTAWANGANILQGLGAGLATAVWEGASFQAGLKIGSIDVGFGGQIGSKVLTSLCHAALRGGLGGSEVFVDTLIGSTYQAGYTDENGQYVEFLDDGTFTQNVSTRLTEIFEDNGGWGKVGTKVASNVISSVAGDLIKGGFDKIMPDSAPNISTNKFNEAFQASGGWKNVETSTTKNMASSVIGKIVSGDSSAAVSDMYDDIDDFDAEAA